MRFGKWDVWSLYREHLLETVASELAKYNSHIVAVQESDWLRVAVSQQLIIHSYEEMGMLIIT
jgi:hypothetical protein